MFNGEDNKGRSSSHNGYTYHRGNSYIPTSRPVKGYDPLSEIQQKFQRAHNEKTMNELGNTFSHVSLSNKTGDGNDVGMGGR